MPQTVQSALGISYLTLNHTDTATYISARVSSFETRINEVDQLPITLQFYEPIRQKSFFGVNE
jgi:hypothetical protein